MCFFYQKYGFYESIDYTPNRLKIGQQYETVKTYMAHHQGLILLSINNIINNDIEEESQNVLFFGRISQYKGVEYLCEAMKIVQKALPNATLTIAGGGKFYFDISEYENLPYIKIINRYVGMEELAMHLSKCAISVCPYTDATQSGVIMTCFSLCKPVIATNVGGLGEMVENHQISVEEIEMETTALQGLLNDYSEEKSTLEDINDIIGKVEMN